MAPPRTPLIERIWRRVEVDDNGCWIYTGYLDKDGYGRIHSSPWEGGRRWRGTHVWVWESVHGPIPAGLEPDHLCRVKACCNPDHIELVTHQVNAARRSAEKTHCPQDHPYDEANTYITPSGQRQCRRCRLLRKAERRVRLGREVAG